MKKIKLIALLTGILSVMQLAAQDTMYVGNMFHVTPGTIVSVGMTQTTVDDTLNNFGDITINGNFTNSAAGNIFNDDSITVYGDWTNTTGGKYQTDPSYLGTVLFSSASTQQINHAENGGNFYHVAFHGGGDKVLNGYMKIDSTMNLVLGNVLTDAGDTLVLLDGDVIGGSGSSFITGAFYNQGYDTLDFPLGFGLYRPLRLLDVPVSGDMPFIGFEFSGSAHGGTTDASLYDLISNKSWEGHIRSGIYLGSKVRIQSYAGSDGIADYSETAVAQSSSLGGVYRSIGNDNIAAATNVITSDFDMKPLSSRDSVFLSIGRTANMTASVDAFLQGSYSGGAMNDSLFDRGELDMFLAGGTNPYGINMLEGYSHPQLGLNGPVDVLSLYLRSSTGGANLDTTYCWLMTDGTTRDFYTGTLNYATFVNYSTLTSGNNYYVVTDHRNHAPIMSNVALVVDRDIATPASVDLRSLANIYGGGAWLLSGDALMYTGNAEGDKFFYSKYIVDADDFDKVRIPANNGMPTGYMDEDVNLDGRVNSTDWDNTKTGVDRMYYSTVPF